MANEQIVAELQALKAEPGFQFRWQEIVQRAIDAFMAPAVPEPSPPPPPPVEEAVEEKAPKGKATTAASTAPAKMKGK